MTNGVVTKNYVKHYQKSFIKEKEGKSPFYPEFFSHYWKACFDVVVSLLVTVLVLSWLIPILGDPDQTRLKRSSIFLFKLVLDFWVYLSAAIN